MKSAWRNPEHRSENQLFPAEIEGFCDLTGLSHVHMFAAHRMKAFSYVSLTLSALMWVGCLRAQLVDGIKSVVHDAVITQQDVEELTRQNLPALQSQYGDRRETFEKKYMEAQNDNLEQLISQQLILHDFKTAGYNVPESIIDDEVQDRIRARFGGDRVTLMKTLQAEGLTYEKFRQGIRERFIVAVLKQKNVSSEIIVSPHKVETFYLSHRDNYKLEDQVKLRMIVLKKSDDNDPDRTRKRADEILYKLKEGATWAEMATAAYNQGSQRKEGGDLGWIEASKLRKELAEVVTKLKPGERSDIIETTDEIYLVLLEDKRPAHFKSLGEVRDQIEKDLVLEERSRLEKQWIEKLKKKTFVRYFY
jgi:parvulin-like peptidyl-prolyl isomerase